jgi:hypothetical protein
MVVAFTQRSTKREATFCLGCASCSGECGDSETSGQLLNVEIAAAGLAASGCLSPVLILVR